MFYWHPPRERKPLGAQLVARPRRFLCGGVFAILQQMATFRPPTDPLVYFDDGSGGGIFSYLSGWPRGRNVFKMTDGSFQENQPGDDSLIAKIYHGGHIHELTAAEEADLIAAGYGDYIEA